MKQIIDQYLEYAEHLETRGGDFCFRTTSLKQTIAGSPAGEKFPYAYFYPDEMIFVLWRGRASKSPLTHKVMPEVSLNLTKKTSDRAS